MSNSPTNSPIQEISVEELAQRMANSDEPVQLIDVRELQEVAIAGLPGFKILPLSEFAQWSGEIHSRFDPRTETIVMCHHGGRSAQMCYWLHTQGFQHVKNVKGGIDAYALVIDESIRRY